MNQSPAVVPQWLYRSRRTVTRRSVLRLAAATACSPVFAQSALPKTLRVLIAFAPGGAADLTARAFAVPLGELLGTPVLVESHAGADGVIAADLVAKSPPDAGALFLGTATTFSYAPAVRKSFLVDPVADFTPIARIGQAGFFLFENSKLPAQSVAELVQYARSQPQGLLHGAANGTSQLTSAIFARIHGIQLQQVPYKGDSQLLPDLVSGRVQFTFGTGTFIPLAERGDLRVLMTTLPERSPLAPQVPTWQEAGLPPLDLLPWFGLFGPSRMPPLLVERLSSGLRTVLADPQVKATMAKYAFQVQYGNAAELTSLVRSQAITWADAARLAGVPKT